MTRMRTGDAGRDDRGRSRASGFSMRLVVPRSNVGEAETANDARTRSDGHGGRTGHHRRDASRPSGMSTSSALSGNASAGSQRQLSSQAAAIPPGREPGLATSASTA